MKTKAKKKLSLEKVVLQKLTDQQLKRVMGGGSSPIKPPSLHDYDDERTD